MSGMHYIKKLLIAGFCFQKEIGSPSVLYRGGGRDGIHASLVELFHFYCQILHLTFQV